MQSSVSHPSTTPTTLNKLLQLCNENEALFPKFVSEQSLAKKDDYETAVEFEKQFFSGKFIQLLYSHTNTSWNVTREEIKKLLQQRSDVIANTPISYFAAPQLPINKFFMRVAELVTQHSQENFLHVLIPGVSTYNQVAGEEEKVTPKNLQRFILAEDNKTLIDVSACLQDYEMDEAKELRHTQLYKDGQKVPLTPYEVEQVICHSDPARAYYLAISQVNHKKETKDAPNLNWNFYTFIKNLVENLRKGSNRSNAQGTGSEFIPGPEAVEGIGAFYQFVQTLRKDEKEFLFNLTAPGRYKFSHYWNLIFTPGNKLSYSNDGRNLGIETCVSLLSNDFETIQQHNSSVLMHRYPFDTNGAKGVAIRTAMLKGNQAKSAFLAAIANPTYHVTFSYGQRGKLALINNVTLIQDEKVELTTFLVYLTRLEPYARSSFLRSISEDMIKREINSVSKLNQFTDLAKPNYALIIEIASHVINKKMTHLQEFLKTHPKLLNYFGGEYLCETITCLKYVKMTFDLCKNTSLNYERNILQMLGRHHLLKLVLGMRRNRDFIPLNNESYIRQNFSVTAITCINEMLGLKIPTQEVTKFSPPKINSVTVNPNRFYYSPSVPPTPRWINTINAPEVKQAAQKYLRKFLKDCALRIVSFQADGIIVTVDHASQLHHIQKLSSQGLTAQSVNQSNAKSRHLKIAATLGEILLHLRDNPAEPVRIHNLAQR